MNRDSVTKPQLALGQKSKDNKVHKIKDMISVDALKVLKGIDKDKDMRVLLKFSSKKHRTELIQQLLDSELLGEDGSINEKGVDYLRLI